MIELDGVLAGLALKLEFPFFLKHCDSGIERRRKAIEIYIARRALFRMRIKRGQGLALKNEEGEFFSMHHVDQISQLVLQECIGLRHALRKAESHQGITRRKRKLPTH